MATKGRSSWPTIACRRLVAPSSRPARRADPAPRRACVLRAVPARAGRTGRVREGHGVPGLPPDSWAGQIDTLSRWLEQQRRGARCTERCYALERLRITGRVDEGPFHFELTGGVLAEGPVAIPLFGPPSHLRLEAVTEDGKDAAIGFEDDHYYLFTASRRFVLKGTLALDKDLALTIPGPLNTLEAEVTEGAIVEGPILFGAHGRDRPLQPGGRRAELGAHGRSSSRARCGSGARSASSTAS